jgi:DNA-binding response OmpR family regulator
VTTPKTVLVVEDDAAIRRGLVDALQFAGYRVIACADGQEGRDVALGAQLDLAILDVMLPKRDGFAILAEVRRSRPALPVILVTARGSEHDRVHGLQTGADDYDVKPFSPAELVARVEAVMRRVSPPALGADDDDPPPPIVHGALRIEPSTRRAFLADEELDLTLREFELLAHLAAHPGRVFSRDQLMDSVWEYPFFTDTSTVTVHIRRLRAKLGDDPAEPRHIETVWGVGYRLRAIA